ncbi:MAG: hypothetical protein BRC29_03035 [Nanohaloarchaea archaeon SW_7_43_1]|nr:MAG: hypothetical protein BRC29_03035 [Nanohaloarchaea archaeon SW_7_43_1]
MRFETELVSRTIQEGEEYLNFDLEEGEEVYPARIKNEEDYLEVFVGESFDEWEYDNISRKRLRSGWENSFYIEEDMNTDEVRESYNDLFERYSEQIADMIGNRETTEPLNQVKAALD